MGILGLALRLAAAQGLLLLVPWNLRRGAYTQGKCLVPIGTTAFLLANFFSRDS